MTWFESKRIVVPFDFSNECIEAVKVALKLAESEDNVHVLHVLIDLLEAHPYSLPDETAAEHRKSRARESMQERLGHLGLRNVHLDVGIGNPGAIVADLAKEINAGLIVIPSHGRSGVKRLLLGSVAERVVRLAPCPVLVLKRGH